MTECNSLVGWNNIKLQIVITACGKCLALAANKSTVTHVAKLHFAAQTFLSCWANALPRACRTQPLQQRPHPEILSGQLSLQASKLSSAQKHTRSEDVCLLLGRVAIPQREQRYVTTAHVPRQHHAQEKQWATILTSASSEGLQKART